jgi:bla regulator protein BlaR1
MVLGPVKRKLTVAVLLGCMSTALASFAAQVSPPAMNGPSETTAHIAVGADILDRYAGTHQLSETLVLTVRREGDHLSAKLTGQTWLPYLPTSTHEFTNADVKATLNFADASQKPADAVVLHQHGKDLRMPRVSEADGDRIEAELRAKIKSQKATPGSEAALRKLIAGIMSGDPNYSDMSPALQEATRERLPRLKEGINQMGPVGTVQFIGVGNQGWDVYQARHESGMSIWRIHLAANGIIDGALVTSGP